MKLWFKYTIELREPLKCGHKRDCESLRANSCKCTTCHVLLSLLRLHLIYRCEWRSHELSRVDDFLDLLPTCGFVQELAIPHEEPRRWWQLRRNGRPAYQIYFSAPWKPNEDPWLLGHPVVRDLVEKGGRSVSVRRSSWCQVRTWSGNENRLLNHWIQTSIAKRPGCIYSQLPDAKIESISETALPTRVLDLMPGGFLEYINQAPGSASRTVRLTVPPPGSKGRYLTLSHRWGSQHHLRLTKSNLGTLQKGIGFSSLPKTYRDAVIVTAQLGYRYLWIDALCIIQDDPQDWLQESAEMCTVYRNSCCTIFAHASRHDDDGFLGPSRFGRSPDSPSTINKRGWVFQERILSRRILHFARGGVFFEDASGIYTSHIWEGTYEERRAVPRGLANNPLLQDQKPNLDDSMEKPTKWYELVEKYTECQLTYDADRLPAVEGLARYYQELNAEAAYVFGIWLSSLHQGLLWVETDPCPMPELPLPRGDGGHSNVPEPPSWSWAKWPTVRYPLHLAWCQPFEVALAPLLDDDPVVPNQPAQPSLDAGSTAAVAAKIARTGILTVQLRVAHWRAVTAKRQEWTTGRRWPSFLDKKPRNLYDFVSFPAHWPPLWVALDGERGDVVYYDELSLALLAVHVKVTHYYVESDDAHDGEQRLHKQYTHYFLVLRKVGEGTNRYRRVGVGAVAWRSWWRDLRQEVIEIE